jgi:carboxyl-terminal processing protease
VETAAEYWIKAVSVAEEFLPAGSSIISQKGRIAIDNREWRSANRKPQNMPLVVLVDHDTASASEVVAGALQDNDRALIMGQTTFGKGLVQNVVGLPMGSGLTITTARYYTPSGRSIQRTYSGTGMYDYYNHRTGIGAENERAEAHTLTNRPVFGGNGIAPDEIFEDEKFDKRKAALLDPIFFFVRDYVNRGSSVGSISMRDQIRQSIIFGSPLPGQDELVSKFGEFTKAAKFNISDEAMQKDLPFLTRRLNYEIALAAFGPEAAKKMQITADREIQSAIQALPKGGNAC